MKISNSLDLPIDAIAEKMDWLGRAGSGKSYGACKLAEVMLHEGAQIIVLDPVGIWWGLHSGADGKAAGLPNSIHSHRAKRHLA
jgi:uncharacterized protein